MEGIDKNSGKPLTKEQRECPEGMFVRICAACHKFLGYVPGAKVENTGEFSHGVCCECCDKLYGKEKWYQEHKAGLV